MPKKEKKIAKRPVTVPQGPSAMEARAKEKELKTEARLNEMLAEEQAESKVPTDYKPPCGQDPK